MPEPISSTTAALLINQFDEYINAKYFLTDPYRSLIPRRTFETQQGEIPTVVSMSGQLPTAYPENLIKLNSTNGAGPSGDVARRVLADGQTDRTYQLETDAWKSGIINQSDYQWRKNPQQVIQNIMRMMANFTVAFNSDYHRIQNIGMMDHKAVITAAGEFIEVSDSNFDFSGIVTKRENTATAGGAATITLDSGASGTNDFYNTFGICIVGGTGAGQKRLISDYDGGTQLATVSANWTTQPDSTSVFLILTKDLPEAALDWDNTLPGLYNNMLRRGAEDFKIGMADGDVVFSLSNSPEIKTKLFKKDLQVDIRYDDPHMNFTARGIKGAINGFMPNVDNFIIRYDACMQKIYPHQNVAATRGTKGELNPDYLPVSQGGRAQYEIAYIMTREIYEVRPRQPEATATAGAQFKAQNYTAEINWLNPESIDALGDNRLHNKGYFDSQWCAASKPLNPEFGYSVLQRIPSEIGNTVPVDIG